MLLLLAILNSASATETTVDDATIVRALETYLAEATFPFPLPPANERSRLSQGKVLKERIKNADGDLALGMVVSDRPMKALWLGSLDPHFENVHNVRTYMFPPPPDAVTRWYGLVDLPKPFTDRHFVITTMLNRAMASSSGGRMWERSWHLEPDGVATMAPIVAAGKVQGVDTATFDRAIYTPVNHGSWFFLQLDPGHVLLGYSCATVVGGDIPDGLVTQHVLSGLDELLSAVVGHARTIDAHYKAGHALLLGGDGVAIPLGE